MPWPPIVTFCSRPAGSMASQRALNAGWDLIGPLTNAPGPPNFSMQDVAMHYRQFRNADDAGYLGRSP